MQTKSNPQYSKLLRTMKAAGCSWKSLAKETGHSAQHLKHATEAGTVSAKIVIAIEHALQTPIWSTQEEYNHAQFMRDLFTGKHPDQIPVKMLRKIARHHKVDISDLKSRAAIVAKLIPVLSRAEAVEKRIKQVGVVEYLKERLKEMREQASPDKPLEAPPQWQTPSASPSP